MVVCDATCLARSLTLALQVLTVCREVVLCINLMDEARKRGLRIDCERLERLLGVPVVPMAAGRAELDSWFIVSPFSEWGHKRLPCRGSGKIINRED